MEMLEGVVALHGVDARVAKLFSPQDGGSKLFVGEVAFMVGTADVTHSWPTFAAAIEGKLLHGS